MRRFGRMATRVVVVLALLVGLAACAALATPPPYTPLATGGFLGALLACGLVAALAPRRRPPAVVVPTAAHTGDTTRSMRVAGALLLALWGWSAIGPPRAAAQPPQTALPTASKLYPVVVLVDNVSGSLEDGIVDADGNLTASYTQYLGLRGHQIP